MKTRRQFWRGTQNAFISLLVTEPICFLTKAPRTKNSKHETCPEPCRRIQNSKQFQMIKIWKLPNKTFRILLRWQPFVSATLHSNPIRPGLKGEGMNSEERFKFSFIRFVAALCLTGFLPFALPSPLWSQAKGDWKQTWDTVLREAKKEGKVVVFGPPGELVRKAIVEGVI